jgi:general secretion pathway protein A
MYAAFFGLSQPPFSIAPDPRYLFMSERHREALAHLLYGIEGGGGFVLITGEIGAGKTTICRRFLEQIPPHCNVAYIFNPKLTVGDLLKTICHEFHIEVKHEGIGPATIKDYLDPLNAYLLSSHAAGQQNILIIDEAQNLTAYVLELLRLLTNLETNERKLLQIILIGQPELRQILARPDMEQLAQRVIARFHLGVLDEIETRYYISHRLGVAGWQGLPPFTAAALKQVHRLTRGVPRRINLLCDRALLGAYAGASQLVTTKIVNRAAAEIFDNPTRQYRPPIGWIGLAVGIFTGALLTGAAMLWWRAPTSQVSTASAPTSAPVKVPLSAPAPAKPNLPTQDPSTTIKSPLPRVLSGLPPQSTWIEKEEQAVSALSPLWGVTLSASNPCIEALKNGMQCYTTSRMTVNGLRKMDRPALLKLHQPGQGSGFLLAAAVIGETLELRDAQQQRWQMPMSELDKIWQGYYASLWRIPPGQTARVNSGYEGSTAQWMEEQLTQLQSAGQLPLTAKTLKAKVEAFQTANGVEVNGDAGTTTLMLINRARGVDEPRLLSAKP